MGFADKINYFTEMRFVRLGAWLTPRAHYVAFGVLAVYLTFAIGLLDFDVFSTVFDLWVPDDSPLRQDTDYLVTVFPSVASTLLFTTEEGVRGPDYIGRNALEFLDHVHKETRAVTIDWTYADGREKTFTFQEVCAKNAHPITLQPLIKVGNMDGLPCSFTGPLQCFKEGGDGNQLAQLTTPMALGGSGLPSLSAIGLGNSYDFKESLYSLNDTQIKSKFAKGGCSQWAGVNIAPDLTTGGVVRDDSGAMVSGAAMQTIFGLVGSQQFAKTICMQRPEPAACVTGCVNDHRQCAGACAAAAPVAFGGCVQADVGACLAAATSPAEQGACGAQAQSCGAHLQAPGLNPCGIGDQCSDAAKACICSAYQTAVGCVGGCAGRPAVVCHATCKAVHCPECPRSPKDANGEREDGLQNCDNVKDLFGEAKAIIREFDFALRGRYGELEKTADPYGKFHHMSKYSSLYTEEEMERMILETDWGIMAAGFAAMLVFVMLALLRLDLIKSRAIVGFAGVVLVLGSTIFTFGLTAMLGVKLTPTHLQVLPYISLGLGVNDMFVLAFSFKYDHRRETHQMISALLQEAGVSVTLTSVANASAFLVGWTMKVPSVNLFSISAFFAVISNYFCIILGFSSVLVMNANAIRRGGTRIAKAFTKQSVVNGVAVHSGSTWNEKKEPAGFMEVVMANFAWYSLRLPVRILSVLAGLAMLGYGIYGATQIVVGFPTTVILPNTIEFYWFFDTREAYFFTNNCSYVVGQAGTDENPYPFYKNLENMVELEKGMTLQAQGHPELTAHYRSWVDNFVKWMNTKADYKPYLGSVPYTYVDRDGMKTPRTTVDAPGYPGGPNKLDTVDPPNELTMYYPDEAKGWTDAVFIAALKVFTGGDGVGTVEQLSFSRDQQRLVASRVPMVFWNMFSFADYAAVIADTRSICDAWIPGAFPEGTFYNFYGQFVGVEEELWEKLGVIALVIAFVSIFFLYDPRIVLILIAVIFAIVVEVLGFCHFFGLQINSVMSGNLVLCVGMAVEFTSHIARIFMITAGTRVERALVALEVMAMPTFYSAVSTVIGTSFIALTPFPYYRIYYFEMFCLIILFGVANGLLVLPALLSFIGPPALNVESRVYSLPVAKTVKLDETQMNFDELRLRHVKKDYKGVSERALVVGEVEKEALIKTKTANKEVKKKTVPAEAPITEVDEEGHH